MKCKVLHKKLIFFLEKELPENEMEQIKMHISECASCALFLEEMRKVLAIIDEEKMPETNPFLYSRVKVKLEDHAEKSPAPGWFTQLKPALQPIAFSILLAVGVYSGFEIGKPMENTAGAITSQNEIIPYLNEMEAEPIENFLMD